MKTSEGKKLYTLELKEFDIELLLKALGTYQQRQYDSGLSSRWTEKLINKVYRAMGVKL